MTRHCVFASIILSLTMSVAAALRAAEDAVPDERLLRSARYAADEGDMRGALTQYFKVLRQAPNKENRAAAREYLELLGLSGPEIFQLDTAALKPDEWERLIVRLSAIRAQRKREALDLEYAQGLLRLAITPQVGVATEAPAVEGTVIEPDVRVDIQPRELTRGLTMLLDLALAPTGGDSSKRAQLALERMGISGARVEGVRKEASEGKVGAELQRDLVAAVILDRLQTYRTWMEERGGEDDTVQRQRLAKRLGMTLIHYLQKQQPQSALMKQPSPTLDYWRDFAAPRRQDEKF